MGCQLWVQIQLWFVVMVFKFGSHSSESDKVHKQSESVYWVIAIGLSDLKYDPNPIPKFLLVNRHTLNLNDSNLAIAAQSLSLISCYLNHFFFVANDDLRFDWMIVSKILSSCLDPWILRFLQTPKCKCFFFLGFCLNWILWFWSSIDDLIQIHYYVFTDKSHLLISRFDFAIRKIGGFIELNLRAIFVSLCFIFKITSPYCAAVLLTFDIC